MKPPETFDSKVPPPGAKPPDTFDPKFPPPSLKPPESFDRKCRASLVCSLIIVQFGNVIFIRSAENQMAVDVPKPTFSSENGSELPNEPAKLPLVADAK